MASERRALGVTVFVLLATASGVASAQTPREMRDDLDGYYHGEQLSAYVIGGMGTVAAGTGAYLVTRESDFARGLGWSWIALGGLQAIGAAFYVYDVDGKIDHYRSLLDRDPAAYRREELDHMKGTTSRFSYYRATELGLVLAGAGMFVYGLVDDRDLFQGIGVGVASLALPLFVIDTINDARAHRYIERVEGFQPSVAASAGGLGVSFGGAF